MDSALRASLKSLCATNACQSITLERNDCHTVDHATNALFIFVESGLIMTACQRGSERRQVLSFAWPGDLMAVQPWSQTLPLHFTAIRPSHLIQANRECIHRLIESDAALAQALFDRLVEGVYDCQNAYRRMLCSSAEARVAAFLIELEPRLAKRVNNTSVLILPMRRTDLADHIGVRTETLSRVLADWRQRGLIVTQGPRHVTLADREALHCIANQEPPPPRDKHRSPSFRRQAMPLARH